MRKGEERHDSPKRVRRLLAREARKGFNRARHLQIRKCQLRLNATKHELLFKSFLDRLGYRYKFQKGFLSGGVMFIADFYFPKPRLLVVEIDGDSHLTKKQARQDAVRDAYFVERGLRVIRLTNREVETMDLEEIRRMIGPKKHAHKIAPVDADPAEQFKRFV